MMSALGALRRVMKLKIKKKSTAKPTTTKKRRALLKVQWMSQEARRSKKLTWL